LAGISLIIAFSLIYSIVVTKLSKGICIALHNDIGLLVGETSITTAWSRQDILSCNSYQTTPCQVYLTLGELANDVIINAHYGAEGVLNPAISFKKRIEVDFQNDSLHLETY